MLNGVGAPAATLLSMNLLVGENWLLLLSEYESSDSTDDTDNVPALLLPLSSLSFGGPLADTPGPEEAAAGGELADMVGRVRLAYQCICGLVNWTRAESNDGSENECDGFVGIQDVEIEMMSWNGECAAIR